MIAFPLTTPTASKKTPCVASAASLSRFATTGEDGDDFRKRLACPRSPAKKNMISFNANITEMQQKLQMEIR
ncbi:Uncharacterized protein DBV15_01198 [Temnothorax longispinosus]|uniref:Uncharacterized protein n=1 Tax=Temnothorax longispinosus TaxID=300112 RepID=A0A4S2JDA3_9HYME|nr:Uncharacterized protein DBV15_01198 [Temnothorax longispinosus]